MAQRLNSFFKSNQELCQISGKARQLRLLQQQYAQVCPASLLRASHIMQLEDKILTLSADNGAIASKLRQMTPELIRQLQLHGCEVTGIQVRVQVTHPRPHTAPHVNTLSNAGKQQINELAEKLLDSPLKSALKRLLASTKAGRKS